MQEVKDAGLSHTADDAEQRGKQRQLLQAEVSYRERVTKDGRSALGWELPLDAFHTNSSFGPFFQACELEVYGCQ